VGEWSTLVNPGRRIPYAIQTLTGITEEMIAGAPSFEDVSAQLAVRLEGKVLAAHNARFDYGFLRREFRRVGHAYRAPVLCTVKLSRSLFPEHRLHNLDALIVRHALFCLERHRALGDARALWELAQVWQREHDPAALESACEALLRTPAVPAGMPEDFFDELPESAGVYVFYGAGNRALYVGRAANVRSRVIAHFAERRTARDMRLAEEVKRVDFFETAGELDAYVREARCLKTLEPVHNRQPDGSAELLTWRWRAETPAAPPQLVPAQDADVAIGADHYGVFRSRSSALAALRELAKSHGLCRVALGVERREGPGPCAAHAQGPGCRGACVGTESALSHGMRLAQALAKLRVKPWPYAGRIGVRERDPNGGRSALHVLDRWRYLGTVRSESDLDELSGSRDPDFDLDTYRMLARYLRSPPSGCDIIQLSRRLASAADAA